MFHKHFFTQILIRSTKIPFFVNNVFIMIKMLTQNILALETLIEGELSEPHTIIL